MSPASSSVRFPGGVVLIGIPGGRRVELFQQALARLGERPAAIAGYQDLLEGRVALPTLVQAGALVRIDSPGKDFAVERLLLALGAEHGGAQRGYLGRRDLADLRFERGRLLPTHQWYRGFQAALALIERQLAECPAHQLMSSCEAIALMFDKPRCHQQLQRHGLPLPRALGPVSCYDELVELLRHERRRRVFIKLAHGSSAAGAVAYESAGDKQQATSTVELERAGGQLRLYNTRRMRVYRDWREIAELVDALCSYQVHVEQWLPKGGLRGRAFDLRVLLIGGRAAHVVLRLSRSPMTNLHLLNQRGELDELLEHMAPADWQAAVASCERAVAAMPSCFYAGADLLISPDYRRHAILELNAFGDLLPGARWNGLDPYEAELERVSRFGFRVKR